MKLRIHGDNIIECERALELINAAYEGELKRVDNCLYLPKFELINKKVITQIELFAGHDRWNISIAKVLSEYGAPLREATDAYITKLNAEGKEQLILAVEFCNALPAGNNAWQRNGRAITCAKLGIPYLYFAELGGVELDANRTIKAPRFPNPIVPFSYLSTSNSMKVICLPVYESHPAITPTLREKFTPVFGLEESFYLIKSILEGGDIALTFNKLLAKGTELVKILSENRRRVDTLKGDEWEAFLKQKKGTQKVNWLSKNTEHLIWKKKQSDKVNVTSSFKRFLAETQELNCMSVGASEIPICLITNNKIKAFSELVKNIYPTQKAFHKAIENSEKPLLIVWITGFKPRGDDSRPDRGLVPLARMLFGDDVNILSIVFGPAKSKTWETFKENPHQLSVDNGLWQAVMGLSNFIFADSATSDYGALFHMIEKKRGRRNKNIIFPPASPSYQFSEQDTDTAIHILFSKQISMGIFEGMCNPPGGDWSGVSVLNFNSLEEYRWTSLPRVSLVGGKRPDHVIQVFKDSKEVIFLSIESKNKASDLGDKIGERLKTYVKELFKTLPIAHKKLHGNWQLYEGKKSPIGKFKILSGAAFCFHNEDEIRTQMKRGKLDFIFSFEFKPESEPSILHLKTNSKSKFLIALLRDICEQFASGVKIEIH